MLRQHVSAFSLGQNFDNIQDRIIKRDLVGWSVRRKSKYCIVILQLTSRPDDGPVKRPKHVVLA